jgi:tetratricopeptide (TPR) repeat protein
VTGAFWKQSLFIFLVVAMTVASYFHALQAEFVWDDYEYVVDNFTLRNLDGLRRIWLDSRANAQYYPVVYSTFWIEYQLWQLGPVGYHLTNVLLHATNAILLWVLLRKLSLEGAWLAALIFALHPVHVESVAWISERKNVLSGLFYLSSALAYLRFGGLAQERESHRWGAYALALTLFACALLSKSVTASLPAAILLVIFWQRGSLSARDFLFLTPFFAAGIGAGLHTAWLERVHVGASGPIWDFTFLERLLIATRALCHYVTQLLWPHPLMFSYPRWAIDTAQWWQYLYGIALGIGLLSLWQVRRVRRGPLVAALFFSGTLFPALGFVDLYPMRFSFVADHFQYLASLGVIVPVASGLVEVGRKRVGPLRESAERIWGALLFGIVCALSCLTFFQSRIYFDAETLWRDTLQQNPDSWLAHNNLGVIQGFRGEIDQAREHFKQTLELNPDYYIAETNLAETLIQVSKYDEAIAHLRHALEIQPVYADAHFFLWVALSQLGQMDEAVYHLRQETKFNPSFESHFRAARLLAEANRPRDALLELDLAEQFRPVSVATAIARGNFHMALGESGKAATSYRDAARRNPNSAVAWNNLGRALERLGIPDRAEKHYVRALEIDPNHKRAKTNLDRLRARMRAQSP